MLKITEKAQGKVKEILESQEDGFAGLRVQIVGGGCSGFQYQMGFEKQKRIYAIFCQRAASVRRKSMFLI